MNQDQPTPVWFQPKHFGKGKDQSQKRDRQKESGTVTGCQSRPQPLFNDARKPARIRRSLSRTTTRLSEGMWVGVGFVILRPRVRGGAYI